MSELFLGLISGTSMDGVDAAVVAFPERGRRGCELVATACHAYADDLGRALERAVADPASCDLDTLGRLDVQVGGAFAAAALRLLAGAGLESADIRAIGSHGQTLRHRPDADTPFTLQIGDPNVIVARTGITTVADFRRRDIALGGEAAPLAPAFHGWLFGGGGPSAVVNIGGIANVTVVDGDVRAGFDSGPGNTLMDGWIRRHRGKSWDRDGAFAREGHGLSACCSRPVWTIPISRRRRRNPRAGNTSTSSGSTGAWRRCRNNRRLPTCRRPWRNSPPSPSPVPSANTRQARAGCWSAAAAHTTAS